MATTEQVKELVEKVLKIENEKKLLSEDLKDLYADHKDLVDLKAFKAALKIARIKQNLGDSEVEMENILETLENGVV
jgi:uncharacterized protein (UPF0335 family)